MKAPLDPRRRAALGLPGRGSKPPDPRHIVTPDAFEVHPSLLGIPLAAHHRRLAAIGIDVLLVALLTRAGGILLGLLAAGFLVRIAFPSRATTGAPSDGDAEAPDARAPGTAPGAKLFRGVFGCMGAVVLLVTVLAVWGTLTGGPGRVSPDVFEVTATATPTGQAGENGGGLRDRLRNLADDLGLGFGWGALYFSAFLTWGRGQTPGKRLMRLRVVRLDRAPISLWDAFERYGGYAAGFATGLLGFAQVFWDANRQAIHDKITGTVVIQDGAAPLPEPTRRLRLRDDPVRPPPDTPQG
jgi:uncharacterized RDD family membrane protein YckC